jgi:hypothetical protein
MKKKGAYSVPVQKGTIDSNPPTMKQMPYTERVMERKRELQEIRRGQHTDLATPRRGKN